MQYWRTLYKYYRKQGFPHDLLATMCISPAEASQIARIIEKKRPRNILEVGTFIGLSTGVIALASMTNSTLICVDPNLSVNVFSEKFNHFESCGTLVCVRKMLEHFGKERKTIVLEGYFSSLSPQMREKLISLNDDPDKVNIIGEKVGDFAPYDLVFIDGDHHTHAVYSDLCLVHRYLSRDGIVVLHDLSWKWGEQVYAGISKFIQDHQDFSLQVDNNLGFLSRDYEKPWLVKQKKKNPLLERVERRLITMTT